MPYKHEHAARLRDPDDFDPQSFRRSKGGILFGHIHVPETVAIIWGKLKGKSDPGDPVIAQSLRFSTSAWTVEAAKDWLQKNNVSYQSFEPAEESAPEPDVAESRRELLREERFDIGPCTLEQSGDELFLVGPFVRGDFKNLNSRVYPMEIVDDIVDQVNKQRMVGTDGHGGLFGDRSYRDVALTITNAFRNEDIAYARVKILDTAVGRDLKVIARERIPIGLSMAGYGEATYDEKRDAYVIQKGFELLRVDAVLDPAFQVARATQESREQAMRENTKIPTTTAKEVTVEKELLEQIKTLTDSVTDLQRQVKDLTAKKSALSEGELATMERMRIKMQEEQNLLDARKKIQALVADAEEMEPIAEYRDLLTKQLENCNTPEEVAAVYPRVRETLLSLKGKTEHPSPIIQVVKENGLFGAARPKTPADVYTTILNRFKDTGVWEGYGRMDNPRFVAKTLIDNYLGLYVRPDSMFRESVRNPLHWLSETAGDAEMVSADFTQTAASLLPLYVIVLEDFMNIVNQAFAMQALIAPEGKVFFQNEYYGDGAGAWTKVDRTNFDYSLGQKGEAVAGKLMKIKIESDTVSLETPLKYMGEWTPEAMMDLMAYYKTAIENPTVQALKNETLRSISYQVLSKLLTGTSCSKNDNCVQATGSPGAFSLAPLPTWTGGEWLTKGFTKAIKQAAALIKDVDADTIIAGKALSYLFTEPQFVADKVIPSSFGFTRIGTYQAQYKVFLTNLSLFDNKIAICYRGSLFTDATLAFLPYVLFYLGNLVETGGTGEQSRTLISRFAIQKVYGQRLSILNVTE